MRVSVGSAALIGAALVFNGCTLVLPGYNAPFSEKMVILAKDPAAVAVQVEGSGLGLMPVAEDGRLVIEFPVLPRECSTYVVGMRVKDHSVEARKIILLVRDGRVVRKLSVNQLRRLAKDDQEFYMVSVR